MFENHQGLNFCQPTFISIYLTGQVLFTPSQDPTKISSPYSYHQAEAQGLESQANLGPGADEVSQDDLLDAPTNTQ